MPRTARAVEARLFYHVLNRGNGRMTLFRKPDDFDAFLKVLSQGLERYPVELLSYCLMNNHWHLVLQPKADDALGRFMGWVGVTHVRRHHAHHGTTGGGHIYQGRFKSFVVQDDRHFLALCRYIESNPLRAKMVDHAQDWQWSSLGQRTQRSEGPDLTAWPVDRPRNWTQIVNQPLEKHEVVAIRTSIQRDRPFGSTEWVKKTAKRMGLEYTLQPRGRPRNPGKE